MCLLGGEWLSPGFSTSGFFEFLLLWNDWVMSSNLNAGKALIFRIVHRDNLPWILRHGLYCRNSPSLNPTYRTIGNVELIDKRQHRLVDIPPGGTLSDYVPFYFTPFSPMMLNIKTGYGGITKVPNEEVVILVSSLYKISEMGISFVFTDRHAYLRGAEFFSRLEDLDKVDWGLLQSKDFRRDPDDPGKIERYQAEALVHYHLPVGAMLGIVCYTDAAKTQLERSVAENGQDLQVHKITGWYFQ